MTTKTIFTRNKQENSKNKLKPLKRRNLNSVIVPEDVNYFSETLKPQILNIDSKVPEIFQGFLCEESFSDIGNNILKYKNYSKIWLRDLFLWQSFYEVQCYVTIE